MAKPKQMNKILIKILLPNIVFTVLTCGLTTQAQKVDNHFEYSLGQTDQDAAITINFKDGREIQLLNRSTKPLYLGSEMNLTETLCSSEQKPASCRLILPLVVSDAVAIWKKHPDSSKINQIVMIKENSTGMPVPFLDRFALQFDSIEISQKKNQKMDDNFTGRFVCDSYHWTGIDGLSQNQGLLKWLTIPSWSGENNTLTIETGVSENQTASGAYQIQMQALYGQIYEIKEALHFSLFSGNIALVTDGPVTIITQSSNGELCQSTFSTDFSGATKAVNKLIDDLKFISPKPGTLSSYIQERLIRSVENYKSLIDTDNFKGEFL